MNIGTNLVQNPVVPYHDYTAAKAALLAFTRTAAHELGEYGINVNMLVRWSCYKAPMPVKRRLMLYLI